MATKKTPSPIFKLIESSISSVGKLFGSNRRDNSSNDNINYQRIRENERTKNNLIDSIVRMNSGTSNNKEQVTHVTELFEQYIDKIDDENSKYLFEVDEPIDGTRDERRLRAILVSILEEEVENGILIEYI